MNEPERSYDTNDAALQLGISSERLRMMRFQDMGPKWFRVGKRAIRYRQRDLDAYMDERTGAPVGNPPKVSA